VISAGDMHVLLRIIFNGHWTMIVVWSHLAGDKGAQPAAGAVGTWIISPVSRSLQPT
jgi:malate synthase